VSSVLDRPTSDQPLAPPARKRPGWTFAITSTALFMTSLDNLVVTMALPNIKEHLHASLGGLEWTVSAYTLTFAALLLTGATLGERFGRRRMFLAGLGLFTLGSAAAALAPNIGALIAARAAQGVGAAIVTPLTLTLLVGAVSVERRAVALGAWGAIGGLAVATGPVVGGAIVQGASWQWIFWLNVPIGLALLPLAWAQLEESRGGTNSLDLRGLALASVGLFGIIFGLVRSTSVGWGSVQVFGPLAAGVLVIAAFVLVERRVIEPMLPLGLFRSRGFTASNLASMLMSFGMFGSVFLLAQFLQIVQHYSPLQAGIRTLPWTAMPMLVAPMAGIITQRIGGRPVLATGLFLQAVGLGWLAVVSSPTVSYMSLVPAFLLNGIGMALFFAPMASTVMGSVAVGQEGIASGVNNAIRELGGVFGIAVLASVFSSQGGYSSAHAFVSGLVPAVAVGAGIVGLGVIAALVIPRRSPKTLDLNVDGPLSGSRRELVAATSGA
jgi:EmrB/QacA subfamily drug resistance transporter